MVDRRIAKKIKWLKEKADDAIKNVENFLKLERQHKAIKEKNILSELSKKLVKKIFMDLWKLNVHSTIIIQA